MYERNSLLQDLFPFAVLLAFLSWSYMRRGEESDNQHKIVQSLRGIESDLAQVIREMPVDNPCEHYVSTACHHANEDGRENLHAECRKVCKFCTSPCDCWCHEEPVIENDKDL